MKQVLAVAVAALLVAVAIVVRGALDDDGDEGPAEGGDELVIACVRELRAACEALDADVRIEDPAATIAAAEEVDAWVTFDPWPEIAAAAENRAVFGDEVVPVASTVLVLVTRTAAVPGSCGPEPDWVCVADATGSRAPTLPQPDSAFGTLALGFAARGWSAVERPGEPFARNEFELPQFDAWRRTLRFSTDPVADMIQLAPAGPVATATSRATFDTVVLGSREADALAATPTAVSATAAVIVVGPAADRVADDAGLTDGLVTLGWRLDPEAATTGLPNAGVLFALQEIA
jgi:hypothetical protein